MARETSPDLPKTRLLCFEKILGFAYSIQIDSILSPLRSRFEARVMHKCGERIRSALCSLTVSKRTHLHQVRAVAIAKPKGVPNSQQITVRRKQISCVPLAT